MSLPAFQSAFSPCFDRRESPVPPPSAAPPAVVAERLAGWTRLPASEEHGPPGRSRRYDDLPPCAPLLVPEWVAGWEVSSLRTARTDAPRLARETLRRIRFCEPLVERRMAEGLRLLRDGRFDPLVVGHCTYKDLAVEELGLSRTTASELARFAQTLGDYAEVREAFDALRVSRCEVDLLRRVIDAETVDDWIAKAESMPVRELQREVQAECRRRKHACRPEEEPRVAAEVKASREDVDYFWWKAGEVAKMSAGGDLPPAGVVEAVCADWASENIDLLAEITPAPASGELDLEALLARGAVIVEEPTRDASASDEKSAPGAGETVPPWPAADPPAADRPPTEEEIFGSREASRSLDPRRARDTEHLLEILRELLSLKQSLDWQAGRALRWCRHLELDFDPLEELGICRRQGQYLRGLDRELRWRPAVRDAFVSGRIGWTKARLILQVCTDATAEAWQAVDKPRPVPRRGLARRRRGTRRRSMPQSILSDE